MDGTTTFELRRLMPSRLRELEFGIEDTSLQWILDLEDFMTLANQGKYTICHFFTRSETALWERLPIRPAVPPSLHPSIPPSLHPSIRPSVHLSACPYETVYFFFLLFFSQPTYSIHTAFCYICLSHSLSPLIYIHVYVNVYVFPIFLFFQASSSWFRTSPLTWNGNGSPAP